MPARLPGGVERDPAVQADDHEREEGLVELAGGVAAGGVAKVEPDRVGDAVAVVVDVVGDLAGVGSGIRSGNVSASWPSAGTGRRIREAESAQLPGSVSRGRVLGPPSR